MAKDILDTWMNGEIETQITCRHMIFPQIDNAMDRYKKSMGSRTTARILLQYIEMIEILRRGMTDTGLGCLQIWSLRKCLCVVWKHLAYHKNYRELCGFYLQEHVSFTSAMQEFTGIVHTSSEQQKESRKARQTRDIHDMNVLAGFLLSQEELSSLLSYELCTHSVVLFDTCGLLRAANTS